jgi:hypothetical protein
MNLRKKSTREEFERALAQRKPEDFDGHTEFYWLTPEQRLEWLCQPWHSSMSSKAKRVLGVRKPSATERTSWP